MEEAELYKRCNISKDHYYQIRDGKIKRVRNKNLFFQFALVLKLDYFETVYLLNLGGHLFNPSMSMYDYVIAHCLYRKFTILIRWTICLKTMVWNHYGGKKTDGISDSRPKLIIIPYQQKEETVWS